ncbi:recombination-associated protein RdgC [Pelagibaculum spongiae]|uniref:Recombination-associated protein RdgC n=1 Tax=Pelagibaculum spongiae TaxID=2080658 RepID=A0A2V1GUP3_9GAMM|nr:recombination-associated protein RdgC [Pelagibaculum spongiae]PVZ69030.1 recombination-associated protein RdgC [Pelagibaculum spongiae]
MWFRNLQIYRLTDGFSYSQEELEVKLEEMAFKPCGKTDPSRSGWVAALPGSATLLSHYAEGNLLLRSRLEEKILPTSVVKEELDVKVQEIEHKENRKVGRKEKTQLKEEITFTLLPRAFTRSRYIRILIMPEHNLLITDNSSAAKSEEVIHQLRQGLGSLPTIPLRIRTSPSAEMSRWLLESNFPAGFTPEQACEMRAPEKDGGILKVKDQELTSDELLAHLHSGMEVSQLAVNWRDRLTLTLHKDLSLRQIKFTELLQEESDNQAGEDAETRMDADFCLMCKEFKPLIDDLIESFGGEDSSLGDN